MDSPGATNKLKENRPKMRQACQESGSWCFNDTNESWEWAGPEFKGTKRSEERNAGDGPQVSGGAALAVAVQRRAGLAVCCRGAEGQEDLTSFYQTCVRDESNGIKAVSSWWTT